MADHDAAQSFTTGAHVTGYTLTSIELRIDHLNYRYYSYGDAPQRVRDRNGGVHVYRPGNVGLDLTKNYTFTPSSTVNLLASTTYWVGPRALAALGVGFY